MHFVRDLKSVRKEVASVGELSRTTYNAFVRKF